MLVLVTLGILLVPMGRAGAAVPPAPRGVGLTATWMRTLDQRGAEFPVGFERNDGQADPGIRFLVHGGPYPVAISAAGAILRLPARGTGVAGPECPPHTPASHAARWQTVRLDVQGTDPVATMRGLEPLPGRINVFRGNDPRRWRTGVPTYEGVEAQDVYPGVDLVLRDAGGVLEYLFTVAPGADPDVIRMAVGGEGRPRADPAGNLVLDLPGAAVIMHAPLAAATDGGERGVRSALAAGYVLAGDCEVRLAVGRHDPARTMLLRLDLDYTSLVAGDRSAYSTGIAADGHGNAYVTGATRSPDKPGAGVFVTKLDRRGELVYEDRLEGSGDDSGLGIAVSRDGDARVTGRTSSPDFPTASAIQPANHGGYDAFVARLDRAGGLIWSTLLGGRDYDQGSGVALDQRGDAYVTGTSFSSDFPRTQARGPAATTRGSSADAFVVRLDGAGRVVYATHLGGGGYAAGNAIAVDREGGAYVTGVSTAVAGHAFAARLDQDGGIVYVARVGGGGDGVGAGIAVDRDGDAYVTGTTRSADMSTRAPPQPVHGADGGGADAFVTRLDEDGHAVYATYLGGAGADLGLGVAVGGDGDAYVTGATGSAGLPGRRGDPQVTANSAHSVFVASLDDDGRLLDTAVLRAAQDDLGLGIACDERGTVYVTGETARSFIAPGLGPARWEIDALVVRLRSTPAARR